MTAVSQRIRNPKDPTRAWAATRDTVTATDGWRACLTLGYAAKHGRSWLLRQERRGPLYVQKPFYPEGPGTCHTYIVHPPGGVVGKDRLDLNVTLGSGSQVLITTPAAAKFYRSGGGAAEQTTRLDVGTDAVLEWLPQETIIYDKARARMRTRVRLGQGARFMGWEMICLGLPACDRPFTGGRLDQCFEVWQEDRPLFIDPLRIENQDPLLTARWGMAAHPVVGILAATVDEPDLAAAIRERVTAAPSAGLFAVTRIQGLTLCRFLGDNVYTGLKLFINAWEILRPALKGSPACAPRIWAT